MEFAGPHDNAVPAPVVPTIQVSWSQPRAWHGDTVKLRVQMGFVRPGFTLQLHIYIQGNPAAFDGPIALPITGSEMEHPYTIDWRTKNIPAGTRAFVATASVVELNNLTSANSPALLVDLFNPIFSA
jgi:hypothetical protein